MRALIVDDSSFIRDYLRQLLHRMGITCEEAVNGSNALEVLAGAQAFDLMLLDVNMPVMNGLECVKALRGAPGAGDEGHDGDDRGRQLLHYDRAG
jgi:two-component system, chemotaxis family, chemotaxis protein CheY